MADLDARFNKAVQFVRNSPADPNATNDHKLKVYALYKQATEGNVKGDRPGMLSFEARAKWDAWKALEGTDKETAQEDYIEVISAANPNWEK